MGIPTTSTTKMAPPPSELISYETLLYLGLTPESASSVWHHYLDLISEQFPENLIDTACRRIRHSDMASTDEWDGALAAMGVARELRDGILAPGFDRLRATKTAKEWVVQSFRERYHYLDGQKRPFAATLLSLQSSLPAPTTATDDDDDDDTTLYAGGGIARLAFAVYTLDCRPPSDAFGSLASHAPSDLVDAGEPAIYLAREEETARHNAMYAARRNRDRAPAAVLRLTVRKTALESAVRVEGEDARRLIWHCRTCFVRARPRVEEGSALHRHLRAPVVCGPVCAADTEVVTRRFERGETWESVEFAGDATQVAVKAEAWREMVEGARVWLETVEEGEEDGEG